MAAPLRFAIAVHCGDCRNAGVRGHAGGGGPSCGPRRRKKSWPRPACGAGQHNRESAGLVDRSVHHEQFRPDPAPDLAARVDRRRRGRRRHPPRRAARHRHRPEPARRRCRALHRRHHHDHPVDRTVRRDDPDPVADQPGHRLPAGGDRHPSLFAAADRPQHLHRHQIRRPRAARGRARHGHDIVAAAASGGDPDRAADHHGRRAHCRRHQYRHRRHRRLYRRRRARHADPRRHHPDRSAPARRRRAGGQRARCRRRLRPALAPATPDAARGAVARHDPP